MDDVSPELKNLLDYIDGKEPRDDFTKELDKAVQSLRRNEKWRLDYMTLYMKYQEIYEEGIEQGDRKRAMLTAEKMIKDGDLPMEKIALYSGLSLERVHKLREELQTV